MVRKQMRFDGPLLPGPNWNEPLEMFDPEHLRLHCSQNPRVCAFLSGIESRHGSGLVDGIDDRIDLLVRKIADIESEVASLRSSFLRSQRPDQEPVFSQTDDDTDGSFTLGSVLKRK